MQKINRIITSCIKKVLNRGKSILLLGPRQSGKTTLLTELHVDMVISLARPLIRQQYERDIDSFSQEVEALKSKLKKKPLIAVDEIQKVPELMDATQDLIDRQVAQFILTGSSARKLRKHQKLNWLPGRIVYFHLDPLTIEELPKQYFNIENILIYGTLPGIVIDSDNKYREQDLESYVVTYLEEEIRQEALVRQLGDFAKFLRLAAAESGNITNFNNIASDVGVAQTTIASYYQILEDCLIAERIEPFLKEGSIRRRLVKSCKYLFFDLGVRRLAAREGNKLPIKIMGQLFEQFVGLELFHLARSNSQRITVNFWRDLDGREVDWILSYANVCLPIEVKLTTTPNIKDARHLKVFLNDYHLEKGYLVCCCNKPRKLDEQITAIPWQDIKTLLENEG